MGRLTTHVLDTATGRPAAGLLIRVERLDPADPFTRMVVTNADGRVDGPLLEGEAFVPGQYRLDFHAGDYWRAHGVALADPAFLDVICIRFGISDPAAHYHVPLLVSPHGYTTYRGS